MSDDLAVANNVAMDFSLPDGTAVNILSGVDCRIRQADRIALVGPSGSGKSTLLHVLGGLVSPTRGAITWPALGNRESLQPEKITFVFQTPSLFPALTAVQNVTLPLLLAGDDSQADDRAMAFLSAFDLGSLANKLPEELSGGQAQRVAMARALVVKPSLILADEPTGQLDSVTSASFLETVLALIDGTNTALLVATHDRAVADRMNCEWTIDHGMLRSTLDRIASKS
ncbi:MAG: ABC transporter ATP-binding protein [Afipia sp.]|nr:ABC transporter ATP-binding protein [Afipia sp.]